MWTAITAAVDFADVLTFIGVAAAAVFGVRVALRGISFGKKVV